MVEAGVVAAAAQFGVAGLIGWMWLSERRAAAVRERQIGEAHGRLRRERVKLGVLLRALEHNTRAMTALEVGQRRLLDVLEGRAGAAGVRRGGDGSV